MIPCEFTKALGNLGQRARRRAGRGRRPPAAAPTGRDRRGRAARAAPARAAAGERPRRRSGPLGATSGISARTRVPVAGARLATSRLAVERPDAVGEPAQPRPAARIGAADAVVGDLDHDAARPRAGPGRSPRRPARTWPRWSGTRPRRSRPPPPRGRQPRRRVTSSTVPGTGARAASSSSAAASPRSVRIAGWMPRARSRSSAEGELGLLVGLADERSAGRRRRRSSRLRAMPSFSDSATSRCWAPSCRSRSMRRRASSAACDDARLAGARLDDRAVSSGSGLDASSSRAQRAVQRPPSRSTMCQRQPAGSAPNGHERRAPRAACRRRRAPTSMPSGIAQ